MPQSATVLPWEITEHEKDKFSSKQHRIML